MLKNLLVVILLAFLGWSAGCKRSDATASAASQQMPPPLVSVAEAIARDVPVYLDEIGRCASKETVSIAPQVAGQIESVHFVEGAEIKQGDLLFTIDPRPFRAALAQAEAALAQNRAALQLAQSEFARVEALRGTSAVSQTEYDQRKNAVAVADAQVQAGQAALDVAQLNLNYCSIKSPITGRAGQRLIDPGNVVKANEGTLVVIQSLDPIYADFTIAENNLMEVRHNMANGMLKAMISIPNDVASTQPSTAPSTQPIAVINARQGELTFLDNGVQEGAGSIKLRVTVPNQDRHFWPGQFVQIRLVLFTKSNAILIPSQAVQVGQIGPYVYVVKPDGNAEQRPVATGQKQGSLLVVDQGVGAGERVIVAGHLMVIPGKPVRIEGAPAAGSPAPTTAPTEGK